MRPVVGLIAAAIGLIVLFVTLPFPLYLLARKPVLRRLAVRNAARRPRETFLVLLGSMLGTAIITSSFVVGDTLAASVKRSAFTQLGPVDVTVATTGTDTKPLATIVREVTSPPVDGVLELVMVTGAVSGGGEGAGAEPHARLVEVDFAEARAFGGDHDATGISGATPPPGRAVIGKDLATALGVAPGDTVVAHAYGSSLPLVVDRVVARRGVAGLSLGAGNKSLNLFVAPGTIADLAGRGAGAPPTAIVAVSAAGGVLAGADRSEPLRDAIRARLDAKGQVGQVVPVKHNLIETAETEGSQFTQLFFSIGFFSVLAGMLLLVNIFVMLAQERKTELGMLRAVGLRRSALVSSFHLEGWLYALGSSVLGMFAGLLLGRVIVAVATGIFDNDSRFLSVELQYAPSVRGVVRGFQLGFVLSVVTVFVTAVWVSRLNVIRAIRDLPDPDEQHRSVGRLVLGALGFVLGSLLLVRGIAGGNAILVLGAPGIAALGLTTLLGRLVPRRALVTLLSIAVLAWEVLAFELVPRAFRDGDIEMFIVQGVSLTAAAVALVSFNQDVVHAVVHRLGGGHESLSLRLGLAYPLARRFRTAMILTMYALVVFTLTFIIVFSHLFTSQIDNFTRRISGGFDISLVSNSSNPVPPQEVAATPGVEAVAVISQVFGEWKIARNDDFQAWEAGAYDEVLVQQGVIELDRRDPRYPSDAAAYRAVLADPSLVILPQFFLVQQRRGPPPEPPAIGEVVTLRDPLSGRTRDLRVAGISVSGFANTMPLMSRVALVDVFGDRVSQNILRIAVEPGADAGAIARQVNARYIPNGADARAYRELAAENLAGQQSFLRLMQGYLALGLLVGIAGLGVVMVRAVRERRRQIGVLRSLGFSAAAVRRAFVTESAFVAFEGVLVGTALALVTSWRMVGAGTFGGNLPFSIPWLPLLGLIAGTFVASMLATATPAQQASRIRPAIALRMTD